MSNDRKLSVVKVKRDVVDVARSAQESVDRSGSR